MAASILPLATMHLAAWGLFAWVVLATRFAWGPDRRPVVVEGRVEEVTPRPLEVRRDYERSGELLRLVAETVRAERLVVTPTGQAERVTITLEGVRVVLGTPLPARHTPDELRYTELAIIDVDEPVRVLGLVLERPPSAAYRAAQSGARVLASPVVIETRGGAALVERWHRALRRAHVICGGLLLAMSLGDLFLHVGGIELPFGSFIVCWLGVGTTWNGYRPWWLAPTPPARPASRAGSA